MARTIDSTAEVPWSLFDPPIRVGDRVRSLRGYGTPGWGEGAVTRIIRGYPEHACPDHALGVDECVCAGENDGRVRAMQPAPVVTWSGRDPNCISPEDEGERWERA